jgi:hypothetical protein
MHSFKSIGINFYQGWGTGECIQPLNSRHFSSHTITKSETGNVQGDRMSLKKTKAGHVIWNNVILTKIRVRNFFIALVFTLHLRKL